MIREFATHHMKTEQIKIDQDLSHAVWKRGIRSPPRKIRVKMAKTDEGYVVVSPYEEEKPKEKKAKKPEVVEEKPVEEKAEEIEAKEKPKKIEKPEPKKEAKKETKEAKSKKTEAKKPEKKSDAKKPVKKSK